jgi:NAD(P)-dependent dehydrogenase (short-subunit alcohol dehydrogenase family)
MRLDGRCALITGAGSGLGRATAEALHAHGASLVLADVDLERLKKVASSLGERVFPVVVDVRESDQVAMAVTCAQERFRGLHIAVNCAGIPSAAKTVSGGEPHDLELWRRVIDVNLTGTFNVIRLAAALMMRNSPDEQTGERGIIINTASIAAFDGQRGQAAYAASKAGVIGLSLPVARDLAEHAIRCLAVAPGLFETSLLEDVPDKGRQALRRSLLYPARPGHPEEFAALVRHVIENPYINGTWLRLDGGARLPA